MAAPMGRTPQEDVESTQGQLSFRTAMRWYVGTIMLVATFSIVLAWLLKVHPLRSMFVLGGALYLSAAIADRPRTVFLLIRNLRWFALVREDFIVRWLMIVIGLGLVVGGLALPGSPSW